MKILITGAASGIAYLAALTLAERGHFVYLTCHNEKEVLKVKEKVNMYKNIEVLKIDITKEQDRKKVVDLNIDVLLSNAAIGNSGSILESNIEDVRKIFETNLFSSLKLIQDVLKQMIEKDNGKIIVMSSLAAEISIPFLGVYSATKASISSIIKSLRLELNTLDTKVDVAIIEPGLYHTGFNNYLIDSKYDEGKYFKKISDTLYNLEHSFLYLFEKKNLDSIVVQIVRAIEDEDMKKVYKAPFMQSFFVKLISFFN